MTAPSDATVAALERTVAALRTALGASQAERDAALGREAALAEVLDIINRSPGDPGPVFDAILEKAHRLCGADLGSLMVYDGDLVHAVAVHGYSDAHTEVMRKPYRPGSRLQALIRGERFVHVEDMQAPDVTLHEDSRGTLARLSGVRTFFAAPLRRHGTLIGFISAHRQEVRPFSDAEITLLESFAAQAAIAMENARLLGELRDRTAELGERNNAFAEQIEHQTATIDVLKVMSASPGDPQPVFNLICDRARALTGAMVVALFEYDGALIHFRSNAGIQGAGGTVAYATYATGFPRAPDRGSPAGRAILDKVMCHVRNVPAEPGISEAVRNLRYGTQVSIPLLREGRVIGALSTGSTRVDDISDSQIELLKTFAEQAVIAITSAETFRALQARTEDLQQSLEYQTATSDVLKVISQSTFDLQPVLDIVAETAARLCAADQASIFRREGEFSHFAASYGFPPEFLTFHKNHGPWLLDPNTPSASMTALLERRIVHVDDVTTIRDYSQALLQAGQHRTTLAVPLLREGEALGVIMLARRRVEPFTERQIALVSTFADQAVIAIENTRLLTEQQEALEQQTATAEVLAVINASPGDLTPVFDTILEKAHALCGASLGTLQLYEGDWVKVAAIRGASEELASMLRQGWPYPVQAAIPMDTVSHIDDSREVLAQNPGSAILRAIVEIGQVRTQLHVPLRKEGVVIGRIAAARQEVRPFTAKQTALLEGFAAQAVIAIENARLLNEIRERQGELNVTFQSMADGVALFDEAHHLAAWNQNFQDMLDVPSEIIAARPSFGDYIQYLADRGEYGPEPTQTLDRLRAQAGQSASFERTRPNGQTIQIRTNPTPAGGFVVIYTDITERKHAEEALRATRDAAESALRELKIAQANLVQSEKMASLGQLTAGIAHEIKNPLNFVNNFAALSVDLLDELKEIAEPGFAHLDADTQADIIDLTATLTTNLNKIEEHGKRADGIVKAMLEHSRGASGERREIDINTLVEEALNLAYHGARARDQRFNITLERDYADNIAPIEVNPQDLTRVFLNIIGNGFYAADKRAQTTAEPDYAPTLRVSTRAAGDTVEIRIRDNGTGIPPDIRDKLFQPFFTTKPTGEGTGLGLSITYDIVTKQHGGAITVDSAPDAFTEFTVTLPRRMFDRAEPTP